MDIKTHETDPAAALHYNGLHWPMDQVPKHPSGGVDFDAINKLFKAGEGLSCRVQDCGIHGEAAK